MQFPFPDPPILPASIHLVQPPLKHTAGIEKVIGSLIGLAVGDAVGACVEFRPRQYLIENPVRDMQSGGTWGLNAGQWTDDTSMALCLASSLITQKGFNGYDQMVRYKWWYKKGYLSSTGECFDIGNTTRAALEEFSRRQNILKQNYPGLSEIQIDLLPQREITKVQDFSIYCGQQGQAGNGPLMRLAPVPLFFFRQPTDAVKLAGTSAYFTHGDRRAVDACRYFAALIVAAIRGESKDSILSERFYEAHSTWFGPDPLHSEVLQVARGSYKRRNGYDDGIRGKNYIINTLEAALWAFSSDGNSFEDGVLKAVNLGDDTDTTGAVYGQLAGAHYGVSGIPRRWQDKLYALNLLRCVGEWLYFEGSQIRNESEEITKSKKDYAFPQSQNKTMNSVSNQQQQMHHSQAYKNDRIGYGQQHGQSQTVENSSAHYNHLRRPDAKQKLDPSKFPAAGVPSGFHNK